MNTRLDFTGNYINMHNNPDSLFDEVWRPFCDNNLALDIDETDGGFVVKASVPGIPPGALRVTVRNNVLTIFGEVERRTERMSEDRRVIMQERRVGKFSRSVRLKTAVNPAESVARLEHGVLTLLLPKGEPGENAPVSVEVE